MTNILWFCLFFVNHTGNDSSFLSLSFFFFGCDICIWITGCVLNYSQQIVTACHEWAGLVLKCFCSRQHGLCGDQNPVIVVGPSCLGVWFKHLVSCKHFGNQAVNMLPIAALKLQCSFISAVLSHYTLLLQHWQTENWSLGIQFSRPDHKLVNIISREHS